MNMLYINGLLADSVRLLRRAARGPLHALSPSPVEVVKEVVIVHTSAVRYIKVDRARATRPVGSCLTAKPVISLNLLPNCRSEIRHADKDRGEKHA